MHEMCKMSRGDDVKREVRNWAAYLSELSVVLFLRPSAMAAPPSGPSLLDAALPCDASAGKSAKCHGALTGQRKAHSSRWAVVCDSNALEGLKFCVALQPGCNHRCLFRVKLLVGPI